MKTTKHDSYTFGGLEQYAREIAMFEASGYASTTHEVSDLAGQPLTVTALYRGGQVAKVYEL